MGFGGKTSAERVGANDYSPMVLDFHDNILYFAKVKVDLYTNAKQS